MVLAKKWHLVIALWLLTNAYLILGKYLFSELVLCKKAHQAKNR